MQTDTLTRFFDSFLPSSDEKITIRFLKDAGKTGTAEYGRKEEGKKLAWMIAFAPFDHPRYAVAIMIEDAVSGGSSAAPKVQKLMRGLFQDDRTARGEG